MAARILAAAPARFALAGISMGGYAALEIMRQAPGRVSHLALVGTSARPDTPEQSKARRAAVAMLDKVSLKVLGRAGLLSLLARDAPVSVKDALAAMGVRVGREAYARQQAALIGRADSRPHLPAISVPTLVAVGKQDTLTPPGLAKELAAGIPGARLQVVANSGHLPPIERPDATAALFREWLS